MTVEEKKSGTSDVRARLLKTLGAVNRSGKFCTSGNWQMVMPGLEVAGLGPIGLPLTKSQAGELRKRCHQAPYGKGTETVVDTKVRRVWELDPSRFQLENDDWVLLLACIVAEVKEALGLQDRKLTAHLYKLLLYEPSSFFLPHRDGEKLDGMVASLVIALPAKHTGGELVVTHEGQSETIPMTGAASGQELSYAAFYADCEHEVRPLKSGYRLCLTYNLALEKSRGKQIVGAPSYGTTATQLMEILRQWGQDAEPKKLAVTMDHRYTQDGLTLDRLKGVDRSRAEMLFQAAEEADCVAHLALVTHWLSGSAEGYEEDDRYGRRYRRSYAYDEDDELDDDDIEAEDGTGVSDRVMGEVFDEGLSVDHWSDASGGKVSLGEIVVAENELVCETPLADWQASREDFEGYTGNEGMTLQRWYYRAAVVIWPRARHFELLAGAGTDASIGSLQSLVKQLAKGAKSRRAALHDDCLKFAAAIVEAWQPRGRRYWSSSMEHAEQVDRNVFPRLLCELEAADLLVKFVAHRMPQEANLQLDASFVRFCNQHGWETFEPPLASVLQATNVDTVTRNAQLLETLCRARDKNAARLEVCARLGEQMIAALIAFDENTKAGDWLADGLKRDKILAALIGGLLAIDAEGPLRKLVDHALADRSKYDLTDSHLAAMFALEPQLKKLAAPHAAISHWLAACEAELVRRTAQPPQPPADFRREPTLTCNCADCRSLNTFLADPYTEQLKVPAAAARRQHMEQQTSGTRCDLKHKTENRGRPFSLIFTKTTAAYQAACEIYGRDVKNLERVRRIIAVVK
jgi:hypothetical protein